MAASEPIDEPPALPESDSVGPAFPEGPPQWPPRDPEILECLTAAWSDGSWGRYHGPHCARLVEALCRFHDVSHAMLCSSGTIGVELALRGLGVGSGDEVILAGYDFTANFRAVEAVGARVVLVDIDAGSWCLDHAHLSAAAGSRTRAILASHLHGTLAPMRQIMEFAASRGVGVVEDACQVPGARVGGRRAGTWGDVGVLSFGGSKLLTSGRGGAILTNRPDVYQRAKIYGERGNSAFPLSELQAAVLLPQLRRLDACNQVRGDRVARLLASTADLDGLRPPAPAAEDAEAVYYKVPWLLAHLPEDDLTADPAVDPDASDATDRRASWVLAAAAEGIGLDVGFRGFARRSGRRCRRVGDLLHSRRAASLTLLLHHPILLESPETIDRLAAGLRRMHRRLADD